MNFLKFLIAILLVSPIVAQAQRIEYLTDLEGNIEPIEQLIQEGILGRDASGKYFKVDPNTYLVFGGDLMDRESHSVELLKVMNDLHDQDSKEHPNLANKHMLSVAGNRDLNKLSYPVLVEKLNNPEDPTFVEFQTFLKKAQATSTPQTRVRFWAEKMGLGKAVDFHYEELKKKNPLITPDEAARDYSNLISDPSSAYYKYISRTQFTAIVGGYFFSHSGLPAQIGWLPEGEPVRDIREWSRRLNEYRRRQMAEFMDGLRKGNIGEKGQGIVFIGDAPYDPNIKTVWPHNNSTVYGPRYKTEDGNFRLIPEDQISALKESGIHAALFGHSPVGQVPIPLRFKEFLLLMADTSYGKNRFSRISINGNEITVRGVLADGTKVRYTINPFRPDPVGMLIDEKNVIALTEHDQKPVLFHYTGYQTNESVVDTLDSKKLQYPILTVNGEAAKQKQLLIKALEERPENPIRQVDFEKFQSEILNGRTVVWFAGSSEYATNNPQIQEYVRSLVRSALAELDPSKVIIMTGGTENKGAEHIVHEEASKMGFYVHALMVTAAVPSTVSKFVRSWTWVGDDWSSQTVFGFAMIKVLNGLGIILGGGGGVSAGISSPAAKGAKALFASNIPHGDKGLPSASMRAALRPEYQGQSFASVRRFVKLLRQTIPSAIRSRIFEVRATEAVKSIRSREKLVVTFAGFSGAEYELPREELKAILRKRLEQFDRKNTVVCAGATDAGIGIVYEVAHELGMESVGLVSSAASITDISKFADRVYMIKANEQAKWGGFLPGTKTLAPVSRAMVSVSDVMISYGGGPIARDEFITAQAEGRVKTEFYPLEMNHQIAIGKAHKNKRPVPTDFRGDLAIALAAQKPKAPKLLTNICTKLLVSPQ